MSFIPSRPNKHFSALKGQIMFRGASNFAIVLTKSKLRPRPFHRYISRENPFTRSRNICIESEQVLRKLKKLLSGDFRFTVYIDQTKYEDFYYFMREVNLPNFSEI